MKRNIIASLFSSFVGFGMLFILLSTPAVQAAGVVTNCTGQGLADAMNSGSGLITFSCGSAPIVITVTQAGGFNAIAGRFYTIDGGDLVILTGAGVNRLFDIQASNASLTLNHIILTDGNASAGGNLPTQGGAILNEGGQLVLDHVTIRNCQSYYAGGAIMDVNGATTVQNSLIENNQSQYGGAIDSGGSLTLINTVVQNNHATVHEGGGLDVSGTVVINNSQIDGNTANGYANGGGGGLNITASGHVYISGSQLNANQTPTQTTAATGGAIRNFGELIILQSTLNGNSANDGGGIYNDGTSTATLTNAIVNGNSSYDGGGGFYNNGTSTLTLNNVTVSGNSSGGGGGLFNYATANLNTSTLSGNSAGFGGGLYNLATATLTNSTLSGNSATNIGGGIDNDFGTVTLTNSTLSRNSAGFRGGGIYNGNLATLTNSTLSGNSAIDRGGGIHNTGTATVTNSTLSGNSTASSGGGLSNFNKATLSNSTLSGNSAAGNGGGIADGGAASLINVTLSNNLAAGGGALSMESGHSTVLTNTILAYSPGGGNCSGTLTAAKFSLSSDNSCALTGLVNGHNPNGLDLLLTALGNYGGPTLVHMLKPGSPAIAGVVGNDAPAIDQRGQPRPGPDGSYDIGAVERQPDDSSLAPRVYLPLAMR